MTLRAPAFHEEEAKWLLLICVKNTYKETKSGTRWNNSPARARWSTFPYRLYFTDDKPNRMFQCIRLPETCKIARVANNEIWSVFFSPPYLARRFKPWHSLTSPDAVFLFSTVRPSFILQTSCSGDLLMIAIWDDSRNNWYTIINRHKRVLRFFLTSVSSWTTFETTLPWMNAYHMQDVFCTWFLGTNWFITWLYGSTPAAGFNTRKRN